MQNKQLQKLSRTELLQLMLEQQLQLEAAQQQNQALRQQLQDRTVKWDEFAKLGTLAEAAMQLNGVFEAAQAAANEYVVQVQQRHQTIDQECNEIRAQAQAEAKALLQKTNAECEAVKQRVEAKCLVRLLESQAQCDALLQETKARCDVMERLQGRVELFVQQFEDEQDKAGNE